MWLAIRMWLMFLCFRTKPFTEKNLSGREHRRVLLHVLGYKDKGVALAMGGYRLENFVLRDNYDFHTRDRAGLLGILIRVSRLWHWLGYEGYPVIIQL